MSQSPHIVIVEARFYTHISDNLAAGALAAIETAGATATRIQVPGILEIPAALQMAIDAKVDPETGRSFAGGVVLGCAIKGETDHYEHVCQQSIEGTQQVALTHRFPVGNGILTCPAQELAEERADMNRRNFGGRAAEACLNLIALKTRLSGGTAS